MEIYLSPRKSFVAIVVVCALSAAALWVGRAPPSAVEADVAVTVPVLPMNGAHRK
jgi:hypothetical protein